MAALAALFLLAGPGAAEEGPDLPDDLTVERQARAVEIVDGDTLVLEGGDQVRLVGLQAPKLPLGRPGFEAWPLAEEAKAALAGLSLGKRLGLAFGGARGDRHGRLLAHLVGPEGRWIQGRLLLDGMARVYSFHDNRTAVAEMLALEKRARSAKRGIWAHPYYAVRRAEALSGDIGSFQLVDGRVEAAQRYRDRAYVNFGADWESDFTLLIEGPALKRFAAAGLDLEGLEGELIRVRGWIRSYNGPLMEITHPEQIEVLQ